MRPTDRLINLYDLYQSAQRRQAMYREHLHAISDVSETLRQKQLRKIECIIRAKRRIRQAIKTEAQAIAESI